MNAIAAVNEKGYIGKGGDLLYAIKEDMSFFVKTTKGKTVIMGRKTLESLPGGKPLDGRINIILTNNTEYGVEPADNVFITNSIQDTVELCQALFPDKEWFVIGGESIYREFIERDLVSEMRLTVVRDDKDGDTFFPNFHENEWYTYYKSMAMASNWEYVETSFYFHVIKKKAANDR